VRCLVELAHRSGIKLNAQVRLRRYSNELSSGTGQFLCVRPTPVKPSGDLIPLGGFPLKPSEIEMNACPKFKLVCANCDSIGISLDYSEGADSSTLIKCTNCKALRGTLGELRSLANSDQRDRFEL
jgi:hypothetical protein